LVQDERLDPEVRAVLAAMEEQGGPPLESLPPATARELAGESLKAVSGEPEQVGRVENLQVPGPGGPIPIRVYTPETGGSRPGLVYFHGGGWVVGNLDTHDGVCRALARRSGAVVVSVVYRLAPEHKFPAAVDDSYAATVWVAENAASLGIDPGRIAVGGDSAGGTLSTVIARKCRDHGGPALALQVLIYPVANMQSFDTGSHREFADGYYLTAPLMEWFRALYLGHPEDGAHIDTSPLFTPDLRGLPPAIVITAECDILRDEGEAYAKRLQEAGVPVTYTLYKGMIHPFFSMPGVLTQARKAIDQVAAAVRDMQPASRALAGSAAN
jgi:acetyl esterase